jgi:hypothetical protein
MLNDLFLNSLTGTFCYHYPLPFIKPPKGNRSSSFRVTNQISLCEMAGSLSAANMLCDFLGPRIARTFLGTLREVIRSYQKLIFFYSKLMVKMVGGRIRS